jgi:hypothetical protein
LHQKISIQQTSNTKINLQNPALNHPELTTVSPIQINSLTYHHHSQQHPVLIPLSTHTLIPIVHYETLFYKCWTFLTRKPDFALRQAKVSHAPKPCFLFPFFATRLIFFPFSTILDPLCLLLVSSVLIRVRLRWGKIDFQCGLIGFFVWVGLWGLFGRVSSGVWREFECRDFLCWFFDKNAKIEGLADMLTICKFFCLIKIIFCLF